MKIKQKLQIQLSSNINIEDESETLDNINDKELNDSEILDRPDKEKCLNAMNSEYISLVQCNIWELIEKTPDIKIISSKSVFYIKRYQNGEINKYKVRLVARGCEQRYGIDYLEVYSSVARIQTIRALLALSVEMNFHVHQMDVTTAYIYISQPPMFESNKNKVCCMVLFTV